MLAYIRSLIVAARHVRSLAAFLLALVVLSGCARKPPYEGRSVTDLQIMLKSPDPNVQVQGAFGLSTHGEQAAQAVDALARALSSDKTLTRQEACLALGKIGPAAQGASAALVVCLTDPEWSVRRQAAVALGQIGLPADTVKAALERAKHDSNRLVRNAARDALAAMMAKAKS